MKALVLSAGYGTRLGDLTREIPKPMLDVNGKPILQWILTNLQRHGFNEIAINLHFRPEQIREYFGDGSNFGLKLTYSVEPELLGTAGAIQNLHSYFADEELFLVHYGDVVTDQNLSAMVESHRAKKAIATLLLHERAKSNSIVSLDSENRVIGFLERPTDEQRKGVASPWVNSGICICSPEVLNWIPAKGASDLPRDVFTKLLTTKRIYGVPLTGFRCAIDSPERLELAKSALRDGRCHL